MDVVFVEVGGSVSVCYFRQEDMLDCLSLLENIDVACTLYKIVQPNITYQLSLFFRLNL